jgi:hypothetical protein
MRIPLLGTLALSLFASIPLAARAVPFDVIVMSELSLDSANLGVGFNGGWAWLVATSDTIAMSDIQGMTHSLSGGAPEVTPVSVLFNQSTTGPLAPGSAAGGSVANSAALFSALLEPGESLVSSAAFLNAGFDYSPSFTATKTFTGTYAMGIDVATYSVQVHFAPGATFSIDGVQRVSSVPEPGTAALMALGLTGLAVQAHRLRGPRPSR